MGKCCEHSCRFIFRWIFIILAGNMTTIIASEKSMYNVVSTLAPSLLIGLSSFLKVKSTVIKSWMGLGIQQDRTRVLLS